MSAESTGSSGGKVGIETTCSFGILGRQGPADDGEMVFEPQLLDASRPANLRIGWSAIETGFRDHVKALPPKDLPGLARQWLEQCMVITILPKARKPVDAVHGVRFFVTRRAVLSRSDNKVAKVVYPTRAPQPVIALSCMLRSRNDRKFEAATLHSCLGVKETTLTRRLELSGEAGFVAIARDLADIAQMQAEKLEAIQQDPSLLKADPEIGMTGAPASAFSRALAAIEAWTWTPEEEAENARQVRAANPKSRRKPVWLRKRIEAMKKRRRAKPQAQV